MRLVIRLSSVLLWVLVIAFLVGALWIAYRNIVRGITDPSPTVAALLATVAALFLTAQRQFSDREESTSQFYLEQYLKGFDTAFEILESAEAGDPQLRMKWIAAARVLADAKRMHGLISVRAHRYVARMSVPHQSQRFWMFLEQPSIYYYGADVLPTLTPADTLDEAAKASTRGSGTAVSTLRLVPEKVIHTIWQAISYPKDYKDVLGDRFNEGERLFLPEGLRAYLDHLDRWHSVAGQLHERRAAEPRE